MGHADAWELGGSLVMVDTFIPEASAAGTRRDAWGLWGYVGGSALSGQH